MTLVDYGSGLVTAYPHQSRFATSQGASVAQGEVIGYVGCTGRCTRPAPSLRDPSQRVATKPAPLPAVTGTRPPTVACSARAG
jgi:hypothetical protein